jgi:hypothetical protein
MLLASHVQLPLQNMRRLRESLLNISGSNAFDRIETIGINGILDGKYCGKLLILNFD